MQLSAILVSRDADGPNEYGGVLSLRRRRVEENSCGLLTVDDLGVRDAKYCASTFRSLPSLPPPFTVSRASTSMRGKRITNVESNWVGV
jgi:hypothetical protein